MSQQYYISKGNFGFSLLIALKNNDGTPFDLTGNTSIFFFGHIKGSSENKISRTLAVSGDPTAGVVEYEIKEEDFDQAGDYKNEVEVNFASRKETFTDIDIRALENIPR